jgi:hypothetical protein
LGARILPSPLGLLPQTEIYETWKDKRTLEFCRDLLPEYLFTGHEVCQSAQIRVRPEHQHIFDFIEQHPEIFPVFSTWI